MHCHHHKGDEEDEEQELLQQKNAAKKSKRGMDIAIAFYDNYNRAMDCLKKSLDVIKQKQHDQDAAVNFGVGYVENKKITHGISIGGMTSGVYGGTDIIYCRKNQVFH